jgi:hypothetical protein
MDVALGVLSVRYDPARQPDSGKSAMRAWSRSLTGILLILALLPIGCVPPPVIRPFFTVPSKTTVPSGKAVVLYRITAHIGTETVNHPPYRVALTNDEGNAVDSFQVFSPSRELSDEGWAYFLVGPGRYRLAVTFGFFGYPSADLELTVPSEETVIYGGSLSIACRREPLSLFILITDCSDISVSNESKAAESVVAGSLPMETRLLHDLHGR